jgi:hypothetical protein
MYNNNKMCVYITQPKINVKVHGIRIFSISFISDWYFLLPSQKFVPFTFCPKILKRLKMWDEGVHYSQVITIFPSHGKGNGNSMIFEFLI